jgi:HAMP domain-containing protein
VQRRLNLILLVTLAAGLLATSFTVYRTELGRWERAYLSRARLLMDMADRTREFVSDELGGLYSHAAVQERVLEAAAAAAVPAGAQGDGAPAGTTRAEDGPGADYPAEGVERDDFVKELVPSYVARRVIEGLTDTPGEAYAGYDLREAVRVAMYAPNRADAWELSVITGLEDACQAGAEATAATGTPPTDAEGYPTQDEARPASEVCHERRSDGLLHLIEHSGRGQRPGALEAGGGEFLWVARPMLIPESQSHQCLSCHGDVGVDVTEARRDAIVAVYPGASAFGWSAGQVVGAQLVTVPWHDAQQAALHSTATVSMALLSVFTLMFLVLNVVMRRNFLVPLSRTLAHVEAASLGDLPDTPLEGNPHIEIGRLNASINRLVRTVRHLVDEASGSGGAP